MTQIVNSLFADYLEPTGVADPRTQMLTGGTQEPVVQPTIQPSTQPVPTYEQQPLTKTLESGFTKEPMVAETKTYTMSEPPVQTVDPNVSTFDMVDDSSSSRTSPRGLLDAAESFESVTADPVDTVYEGDNRPIYIKEVAGLDADTYNQFLSEFDDAVAQAGLDYRQAVLRQRTDQEATGSVYDPQERVLQNEQLQNDLFQSAVKDIADKYGVPMTYTTKGGETWELNGQGKYTRVTSVGGFSDYIPALIKGGITAAIGAGLTSFLTAPVAGSAAAVEGAATGLGLSKGTADIIVAGLQTAATGGDPKDILTSMVTQGLTNEALTFIRENTDFQQTLNDIGAQVGIGPEVSVSGEWSTLPDGTEVLTETLQTQGNLGDILAEVADAILNPSTYTPSSTESSNVIINLAEQATENPELFSGAGVGTSLIDLVQNVSDFKDQETTPTTGTTTAPATTDTTAPAVDTTAPTTETPVTDGVVEEETTAPVVNTTGGMLTGGTTTAPTVDTTQPTGGTTQPAVDTTQPTVDTTPTTQYSAAEQQARDVLEYAVGSRGEYREDYDYNNDGRVTSADALMALKLGGVSREDLFGYVETIFGSTVDDITASLDSIGDLEEQVTTGQEIIGAITDERDALAGQVATLEGQLADAQAAADAAVAAGDANAAELQANADAIQEQLNATTAELDNANATITGLETELGTTQETLAATQEQLATTQEERDAAQTAVADLTGLLDNANTDLETKTAEIETLNTTVETLNTDIEVLTGDLDTANNNIADLKEQLQTAKDTGADNVADLESQLKNAEDNAAGIQESLDAKTAELDDANATIETLNGEVETLNTTVEDLNGQLEAKQGELDTANTRVSELETELGTTQETLSTTQEELATTQETLATTEEALQERQDELNTANTTIIDLRNQITDVNSELLSTQSDLTAKQTELDNAIANNLENVGELEAEVADLTSKVDDLSAESEDLQDQLQNAQDELDELKQDYSDLSEERDGLLTTIAGLEEDLAASQAATEAAIAEGVANAEAAGEAGYETGYGEGEDVGFNIGFGVGFGEGEGTGYSKGYGEGEGAGYGKGMLAGTVKGGGGTAAKTTPFMASIEYNPELLSPLMQQQQKDYLAELIARLQR
jgi:predicted  nucleic acid-binding Zn-ribbon protein